MIHAVKSLIDRFYQQPLLLLIATAICWASNAVVAQLARGEITPMVHVLVRWVFVFLLVWPFYGRAVRARLGEVRGKWLLITAMAILGFTGFNILFYIASFNTTAVNVGILQGSVPVMVIILAFLVSGTRIGLLQTVGVVMTLIGVATVATRGAPWQMLAIAFNFGDVVMLVACASYACYAVMLQHRPPLPGAVFFTMMVAIALITAVPPALYEIWVLGAGWPTFTGWAITLFVAIFPATLAQQFFMRGVELIGPGRAGVYVNLTPVFAAGMAVVFLGEAFAWFHAAALVLVLGGIALVQVFNRGR